VFHQRLESMPQVWPNHCMQTTSTTNSETYVFPGMLPVPRVLNNNRNFQNMNDYTFNLANTTYELSMIVNREHWEDDQTGLINQRFADFAEAWGTFKDSLFTTLLTDGNVSGSNGWDGVTFHQDSRTIGASATVDNNTTAAAATGTIPTAAELLTEMATIKALMGRYEDDQGRPFNTSAIEKIRCVIPGSYERAFAEAMNSTLLAVASAMFILLFTYERTYPL